MKYLYTFLKKQALRKPYFEKKYEAGASLGFGKK